MRTPDINDDYRHIIRIQYTGIYDYSNIRVDAITENSLYKFTIGDICYCGRDNNNLSNGIFQFSGLETAPDWLKQLKILTELGVAVSETSILLNISNNIIKDERY